MPSVETWTNFFSLKSESIKINPLSITNDPILRLEMESKSYFNISEQAANNSGGMAVKDVLAFSSSHVDYINRCTDQYKKSLDELQDIDKKLLIAFVVAVGSSYLISLIATVAWIGFVYMVFQRATAFQDQQRSLNLLMAVCNWSLGKSGPQETINLPSVQSMLQQLMPVLGTDLQYLTFNSHDRQLVERSKAADTQVSDNLSAVGNKLNLGLDEQAAWSKHLATCMRGLYGPGKGNLTDLVVAFSVVLGDLASAAGRAMFSSPNNP